jgi:hypothetical protein
MLLNLCSIFVGGIITFLIIAFAGNQIAAVGVLKIIMPVFLIVGYPPPLSPENGCFRTIASDVLAVRRDRRDPLGQPAGFPLLMILATGLPWFAAVMYIFTKKVKMKAGR